MEIKKIKKPTTGRQRYFQMFITLGLGKLSIDEKGIRDFLTLTKFVPQSNLELSLYHLRIQDRGREIQLANFSGQLERKNPTQFPYWNIVFETSALTTKRRVSQSILKKMVSSNGIVPNLTIRATAELSKLDPAKRYILPNSAWYPGFFSRSIMVVLDLLTTNEDVMASIRETPEKYSIFMDILGYESEI
jgi:hypothetical protein